MIVSPQMMVLPQMMVFAQGRSIAQMIVCGASGATLARQNSSWL